MQRRILFVLGEHTCVPADPLRAARGLGCRSLVFAPQAPGCGEEAGLMDEVEVIHASRPADAVRLARKQHAEQPLSAVVSYEDGVNILAAGIAAELGLPGHPVDAVVASVDKPLMKERFAAAGLPIARHTVAADEEDAVAFARQVGYPVVVKPCRGGASQGVMRADDEPGLRRDYRRLRRIVRDYGLDTGGRPNRMQLVERYLPGAEISVELVIDRGRPRVTTVFEKPRPLTGPFFEETVYLTPARLAPGVRAAAEALAGDAALALGLWHGPAHCEIRICDDGLYVLEVAGRLLGGACARVFRDCLGTDIHPLLLRLAMGDDVDIPAAGPARPAAALMLPVPGEGRLVALHGLDRARRVPGVTDVIENGCPGDVIVPFPEQACYAVGFIGAAGDTHEQVEDALAWAAASISVELAPVRCQRWTRPVSPADATRPVPGGHEVLSLAWLPAADGRRLAVDYVADIMFGELPTDEALREAECTVATEYQRGTPAGVYLPGRGLMLGFTDGGTGYVCCFGVRPEQRRSGIGSALMTAQLAAFARAGVSTVVSETDPRLPLAATLLHRSGFTPTPPDDTFPGDTSGSRVYSCGLDGAGAPTAGKEAADAGCTGPGCGG
ncbi:MAG TPA: GNAT family N-acetyltransferase [Streptosporangiaceae bacterium]|jgi:biotin carboxylase/ribosomal protein S18 acetylase RimI-like enzyme|nr:GNAT family N-acetyltransferase [Streptosporangiaceae bacterium]